jgi:hypothetical protein
MSEIQSGELLIYRKVPFEKIILWYNKFEEMAYLNFSDKFIKIYCWICLQYIGQNSSVRYSIP